MSILHSFLVLCCCFSGSFVILAANPIHSLIFLILTFFCSACILILFQIDFLALIFIVIYVGAIAILFLFVVMMLNVKFNPLENSALNPFFVSTSFLFFVLLYMFFSQTFNFETVKLFQFEQNIDILNNIDSLGQFLFNYFLCCFLVAGLILLIAVIGAIILTLNFSSNRKNQLIFRQLSRSIDCVTIVTNK